VEEAEAQGDDEHDDEFSSRGQLDPSAERGGEVEKWTLKNKGK